MTIRSFLLVAALGTSACGSVPTDADAPTALRPAFKTSPEANLTFLTHEAGAPSFGNLTTSFWAVKGQSRQGSLFYHRRPGGVDSTEFVRFRVDQRTLLTRPNGSPIADGDSVLITLTIADTARGIVDFQPSGLRFDPRNPARLWVSFAETVDDLNGDGLVDPADTAIRLTQAVWFQESVGGPWQSLKTSFDLPLERVSTKLTGFTRYAMAY